MGSHKNLFVNVQSSITHNGQKWKQPKCPSNDEKINKIWYICIVVYYSAIKRNEILIYAIMWMNPENMLNEGTQNQKEKYRMIPFT